MPRPCKCRLIARQPLASAFKPSGIPGRALDVIELALDELEALRLADLEGLYHDAAAQRMGVSRPTFGRVLECARHKVACALLGSKMLVFKGGPVMMANMRTFECAECARRFQIPHGAARPTACPQCQSANFHRVAEERGRTQMRAGSDSRTTCDTEPGQGRCLRRRRRGRSFVSRTPDAGASKE